MIALSAFEHGVHGGLTRPDETPVATMVLAAEAIVMF